MEVSLHDVKIKMQDNPKKTGAVSLILLGVLLGGMYHLDSQRCENPYYNQELNLCEVPENDSDFDYGELDPQPDNESNDSSDNDVSENNSINVSVTNQTCVDHRNGSNYCTSG